MLLSTTFQLLKAGVVFLVIGIIASLFIDWTLGNMARSAKPTITPYKATAPASRAFVLLPGAQVSGEALYVRLKEFLRQRGNVAVVTFDPKKIDGKDTINAIATWLQQKAAGERVTLVAASMSTLVANDVASELRNRGDKREIDIIALGGIASVDDLTTPMAIGAKIGSRLPFGPISDSLLTELVWKVGFKPSKASPNVKDKEQLLALWRSYQTYPLSGYVSELRYIVTHPKLRRVPGVNLVAVRFTRDGLVRREAAERLHALYGNQEPPLEVDAEHIALLDEPDRVEKAIEKALERLG